MKKEETIKRYGEASYAKQLEQNSAWKKAHKEERKAYKKEYYEENRETMKAKSQEQGRKGGKRYEKQLEYMRTGIPGDKKRIRCKHQSDYKPYKAIIAPESQIHHEWIPRTADYRGVALVENDQHMHGIVDVIEILDGKITLLTEEEVKAGRNKKEVKTQIFK